jgi:hypothetical protein
MKTLVFTIITLGFVGISCNWQENDRPEKKITLEPYSGRSIVFYNVENLFDTIDQPNVQDEDFLPNGKLQYC